MLQKLLRRVAWRSRRSLCHLRWLVPVNDDGSEEGSNGEMRSRETGIFAAGMPARVSRTWQVMGGLAGIVSLKRKVYAVLLYAVVYGEMSRSAGTEMVNCRSVYSRAQAWTTTRRSSSAPTMSRTSTTSAARNPPAAEHPALLAFDAREQRRIVHKIDRRLVPVCGLMYCISLLDRTNLGAANIAGYSLLTIPLPSIITLVFFITYVLCQPPATVLTRKIGPRTFLPLICLLWGGLMIGFGFAKDWTTLLGLRFVLGVLEAGC
ncbi:hypothetical protein MRB53_036975 [Persea americana]|nr:hypothetical protein MRB53_036975 [Persea americana]